MNTCTREIICPVIKTDVLFYKPFVALYIINLEQIARFGLLTR